MIMLDIRAMEQYDEPHNHLLTQIASLAPLYNHHMGHRLGYNWHMPVRNQATLNEFI